MKILVVEDEPKLNKGLAKGLEIKGYAVDSVYNGEEGEQMAIQNEYDLIVMDVMMPNRNGLDVSKNLRDRGIATPILLLTAKDSVEDKILGLNLGADDYMVKPFAFEELAARIRTLLRRPPLSSTDILKLDNLRLNTRSQLVTINDDVIGLTLREYGLLEYFLRNKDKVITREDILEHVWDRFHDSMSNVVNVHLKNLRKKLPTEYANRIQTVWGKGYRLV
jgi:two-component system copper resistance phosphate regulon response regulator CusR